MKKIISGLLFLSLLTFGSCKKEEQQKPEESAKAPLAQKQNEPTGAFHPQAGQRKKPAANAPSLQILQGTAVVATIPPSQYMSIMQTKISMGNKQRSAILVRDLLEKYNLKGTNVVLAGEVDSASLTWDQVAKNDVYLFVTPKKVVKVYSASKTLGKVKLPNRVEKITVS
jgi:hypothetical protein